MRKSSVVYGLLAASTGGSSACGSECWHTPHARVMTVEWRGFHKSVKYTVGVQICEPEVLTGGICRKTYSLLQWQQAPGSGIAGTTYQLAIPRTQPGLWRVWPADEDGKPGATTPWMFFFYKWNLDRR